MDTAEALARLAAILPLTERQGRLPRSLATAHRAILWSLAQRGRPLSEDEVSALVGGDGGSAMAELARNDLVVLDGEGASIVGAYPMTTADTPHSLSVSGQAIQAMCALDALAVAPMFDADVAIDSVCEVTGDAVRILQRGRDVVDARPSRDVHVGVQWQADAGVAAETL